jgi:hypothetical protein
MSQSRDDEIKVIVDIDAFPLRPEAVFKALNAARRGQIYALAQTSNHLCKPHQIYGSPVFFAIKVDTWKSLGQPSFKANETNDVGQQVYEIALLAGTPTTLVYPTACLKPKWALSDRGIFGIGTFYENQFFHLFNSRNSQHTLLFDAVSTDVINRLSLNYSRYLSLAADSASANSSLKKTSSASEIRRLLSKVKRNFTRQSER